MQTQTHSPVPIVRVSIEAEFGSEIQHDVSLEVLREFLTAWKTNVESAHKRNRVAITYQLGSISNTE